jgi:hypothetical protein
MHFLNVDSTNRSGKNTTLNLFFYNKTPAFFTKRENTNH